MATSILADDVIVANAKFREGPNGSVTRIVIHATVSPCVKGGARAVARYFQSSNSGGAAHYVVDPYEIIACGDEDEKMAHAPPNTGSIGIELCDPQAGDDDRWNDQAHTLMLARAAALAADIAARHGLPVQWLTSAQLLAGDTGLTSHRNVSLAWHKTDHTDPGPAFPVDLFITAAAGTPPHEEDIPLDAETKAYIDQKFAEQATLIDKTVAKLVKAGGFLDDFAQGVNIGVKKYVDGNIRDTSTGIAKSLFDLFAGLGKKG